MMNDNQDRLFDYNGQQKGYGQQAQRNKRKPSNVQQAVMGQPSDAPQQAPPPVNHAMGRRPLQMPNGGPAGGFVNPMKAIQQPASNDQGMSGVQNAIMGGQPPVGDPRQWLMQQLGNGPADPARLAQLEPELSQHGLRLQKDSDGVIRGRVFQDNGNTFDVVNNNGWGQGWANIDRGNWQQGQAEQSPFPAHNIYQSAMSQFAPQQDSQSSLQQLLQQLLAQGGPQGPSNSGGGYF